MKKTWIGIYLLMALFLSSQLSAQPIKWVVYYSDQAPATAFYDYDLLVFDSDYHPPLDPLITQDKTLLGYISLGEIESARAHFAEFKAKNLLLQENTHWPGSFYIDVRDVRWAAYVIEHLIPQILHQGFHGIFIDTMDNPAELERIDPQKYQGMTQAAAEMIRMIRTHYPNMKIMLNRGYEILPMVAEHIDMVLGESIYTDYNFAEKTYEQVPVKLYQYQVDLLQQVKTQHPALQIFTLDYWYPEDKKQIKKIYQQEIKNGFNPYVATIALDQIVSQP
jgi:uncharacterized protein (TIGR01370 family)